MPKSKDKSSDKPKQKVKKDKQNLAGKNSKNGKNALKDPNITTLENDLSQRLATKVLITHQSSGRGKLQINYNSLDELEGILKRIE